MSDKTNENGAVLPETTGAGRKPFDQLTITDNYMFQAVMKDEIRAKKLLEIILGCKIRKLKVHEAEKTEESGYNSRGIRMDVYLEDDENTVYDIEMQPSRKRYLPKRFRYYQASMDVATLNKGDGFGKLKKSFIIFFVTYDLFKEDRYRYTFKTYCEENKDIELEDDATKIVFNTKGKVGQISDEVKALLAYMDGQAPTSEYTKELDDAVKSVKENEVMRMDYMSINANNFEQQELGTYKTYVKMVRKNMGRMADDAIMSFMDITPILLSNIRLVITQHPDWDDEEVADEVLDMDED